MSITFNDICELLEGVEKISSRRPPRTPERQKSNIETTISNWFLKHRQSLDNSSNGGAVLSAIFPHRRKDRVYGLKPPSLSKKLIKLLNLNNGQRTMMEKWEESRHGDLGAITETVMQRWNGTFKNVSIPIEKVDRLLVQLAARCRFSDPNIRKQGDRESDTDSQLKWILTRLSSWEAKWLVRLILREYCTIVFDEYFLLKQYHFLLPDLLLFQNDFDAATALLRGDLAPYPPVPEMVMEKQMRIEAATRLKAVVGIKVGRPTFHKAWSFKHCFQLTGDCAWAAEVKYDGEYCEIHVDLEQSPTLKIFSKNGKDATNDRRALHDTILKALRVGHPGCMFRQKCIVLGELVLYSDREQKILPFSKIRKHILRSGTSFGTAQDSLPHEWEHLMIVFFDVLVLDDDPIMRQGLQKRRDILRDLVQYIPGHASRSEWSILNFKSEDGIPDLKETFAKSLAKRQEGLVLKPLHAPYFPLLSDASHRHRGYFIKLKKDYLGDMGGERDLGDFAVVGGSFDAQVAAKSDIKYLHWTHFHIGCLTNRPEVERFNAIPRFKIVAALSMDQCIPKPDVKYLNTHGRLQEVSLQEDGNTDIFDFEHSKGYGPEMTKAFKKPFVVEILGGGYEKLQNESFEMLRHPRVKKIHHDRTWKDTVTMEDLERMAEDKWEIPDADKLAGHAKDVALLVKKFVKQIHGSQISTVSDIDTTQETTQQTTQRTSQSTPRAPRHQMSRGSAIQETQQVSIDVSQKTTQRTSQRTSQPTPRPCRQTTPDDAVVQETQQVGTQATWTSTSTTSQFSSSSTQGKGIRASKQLRSVLVREDTSERIARITKPTLVFPTVPQRDPAFPTRPESSPSAGPAGCECESTSTPKTSPSSNNKRLRTQEKVLTPPPLKRRKVRSPLREAGTMKNLGTFECDSQEKTITIYAEEGWKVKVHNGSKPDGRL